MIEVEKHLAVLALLKMLSSSANNYMLTWAKSEAIRIRSEAIRVRSEAIRVQSEAEYVNFILYLFVL